MTLHEKIQNVLSTRPNGVSSREIAQTAGSLTDVANIAIIEAHLLIDRHCRCQNDKWWGAGATKMQRVMETIADYAGSSGKRIFRLSTALKDLPIVCQPTEEELQQTLAQPGSAFKLLPNAMIKKVDL